MFNLGVMDGGVPVASWALRPTVKLLRLLQEERVGGGAWRLGAVVRTIGWCTSRSSATSPPTSDDHFLSSVKQSCRTKYFLEKKEELNVVNVYILFYSHNFCRSYRHFFRSSQV